jgi:predicted Zn-dependent peptidase
MEQLIITEKAKNLVHVVIGIKAGWRHEETGKRGITHFLEHAIFLGNKSHPFPDDEMAKCGASLDGMTLPEHTLFFFTSSKEDFAKIFSLLLSLLFHPEFCKERLEKEKKGSIITAVVRETDHTPWELSHEWAKNLVFNWDFRLSLGKEEDIELLTKEDLTAWHRRYYHSLNSFIVIFGDVQEDEATRLVEEANIPLSSEVPSPLEIYWDKKEMFVERKGTKNVEMVYGFNLSQYDIKWELLSVILGNYPISKLWDEKFSKFTYTVGSQLEWTMRGGGFFLYFGATSIGSTYDIDKNLWFLLENLEIAVRELEFVKKIKLLEILKMKEGGERGLFKFVFHNPFLCYKNFEEMIKRINSVKKEEVLALAEELLNKSNVVRVMVGARK